MSNSNLIGNFKYIVPTGLRILETHYPLPIYYPYGIYLQNYLGNLLSISFFSPEWVSL